MRPATRVAFTLLVGAGAAAWVLAALLLWFVVTRPESTVMWFADLRLPGTPGGQLGPSGSLAPGPAARTDTH